MQSIDIHLAPLGFSDLNSQIWKGELKEVTNAVTDAITFYQPMKYDCTCKHTQSSEKSWVHVGGMWQPQCGPMMRHNKLHNNCAVTTGVYFYHLLTFAYTKCASTINAYAMVATFTHFPSPHPPPPWSLSYPVICDFLHWQSGQCMVDRQGQQITHGYDTGAKIM